ncbi:hypothetical protein ACU4GD_41545 [Cupriavidus basilensis]
MPEPVHMTKRWSTLPEQISALSSVPSMVPMSARNSSQIVREAVDQCGASKTTPAGNNLSVLIERLTARAESAAREGQPAGARLTFARAAEAGPDASLRFKRGRPACALAGQ